MRSIITLLLLMLCTRLLAQQGFAYTQITTDDGIGLASNVVTSIYQDEKGFFWVGTANGLQRFDGSKFIHFSTRKAGSEQLPHSSISQILPADSGKLVLSLSSKREFGLFDPATFIYKKIPLKTTKPLSPRAEFFLWRNSKGDIYLNVLRYGIMRYDTRQNAFVEDQTIKVPANWKVSLRAVHEDVQRQQYYLGCDSGLLIYDIKTKETWSRLYNPRNLAILKQPQIQDNITQVYIDKKRRIWVFNWPAGSQDKHVFDSTGSKFLAQDTIGLLNTGGGYNEYNSFFETTGGDLWIHGLGVLFNYDHTNKRFVFNRTRSETNSIGIHYESVFQMLEDKDGNLWIATDKGLYFTARGSGNFAVINLKFSNSKEVTSITDILELPNGDMWFTSWGTGVQSTSKTFNRIPNYVYRDEPPASFTPGQKGAIRLTWSMCRRSATGEIFIGCNGGVLLVHNPQTKSTRYLAPEEFNNSTIRYITEDRDGALWFGTQGGRLIKYSDNQFTVVHDVGTIIYKAFIDNQGWIWLTTHEKGIYAVNPKDGSILQHYSSDGGKNALYSNTGSDIEQMNDSTLAVAAGALHFINKRTGRVFAITYEDGLPSNTVKRIRKDRKGFLWIITANGLCSYNPNNKRITSFGRKDGIEFAEETTSADYVCSNNQIMFGGSNSLIMFHPEVFYSTKPPPNVTITDFKIFNQFLPVDSLLRFPQVKLDYDQNSISIYFSALSYMQRDKLTYYYKLEGINENWIQADRALFVNYSLLPPGNYVFKIYCENIDGKRSKDITELFIRIRPPFWRTWWFMSSILFVVALLIYAVHDMRVNRLLAVEQIRNRVARDLHDDMGSTLSTINILSSMAKTKMNSDPVRTSEYLSKISDNSQRMMEAMDDIVWSIKPSNDSMQKITARMREFATNVLEAKDIDLDFSIDENVYDVKLNMEKRRDFFLIFKEAVNNAAKYSKADRVVIRVQLEHKSIELLVKDNGIGFDVEAADGGNGLGNMQKRADAMNGRVSIQSRKGEGTTMMLILPTV